MFSEKIRWLTFSLIALVILLTACGGSGSTPAPSLLVHVGESWNYAGAAGTMGSTETGVLEVNSANLQGASTVFQATLTFSGGGPTPTEFGIANSQLSDFGSDNQNVIQAAMNHWSSITPSVYMILTPYSNLTNPLGFIQGQDGDLYGYDPNGSFYHWTKISG